MKTYRFHYCRRQHRTWRALATCMFPRAAWITGDGPFAVLAWCGVTSVTLHADTDAATRALEIVNASGCGGRCTRDHELVRLDLDAQTPTDRRTVKMHRRAVLAEASW
ncbi:hypothetical protein [Actinotalea fermentans]|uniref:Uncharacterized protein n=1 Tax=Actinotalea fermentans TaxID=43671 RepID=A0A511YU57_9CELL|nr:hypothetical protein [Actinotalea fermentans]KGM17179.1 hypothetical protein N867_09230 [Actinotalea fermentans ATCC 43279 = JCM 9966 = DSM 3133]GEN78706.1 hypothetical protein AFE02nite_04400 [Actinotalea fermentans]